MDQLQDWEVYDFYDSLQLADTASWEQTRWLMYVVAQVNSRKQLKVTDILRFPWEEGSGVHKTTITDEEISRLKEKANSIKQTLFNT